jgi:hypothetical protein
LGDGIGIGIGIDIGIRHELEYRPAEPEQGNDQARRHSAVGNEFVLVSRVDKTVHAHPETRGDQDNVDERGD